MRNGRRPARGWQPLLLPLLLACTGCRADDIVVGGERGWSPGVEYADVYARPGDVLVRGPPAPWTRSGCVALQFLPQGRAVHPAGACAGSPAVG